ncbi:MAG: tetratricopeptide repeat protein [Bacteroidetes Order II. Incertae sedis bacterium]|nr:tetratricopeptide repeat protein [Bacteroidetes Order II. bacterium]
MKNLFIFLALLGLCSWRVDAQSTSVVTEARTLIGDGQYVAAIQLLKGAADSGQKSPEVLHWLGVGYHSALQLDQAVATFQEAIRQQPAIRTYLSLGRSFIALGRREEALHVYAQALQMDSTHQAVIIEKARLHAGLREFEAAARYYHKLIARDSSNAYLMLQLADCYKGLGQADAAIIGYERVRRIRATQVRPYLELFQLYTARKAYLSAMRVMDDGLRAMPHQTALLKRRGDLYALQDQYQNALAEYEEAYARKDTSYSLLRAKGIAHYRLGQYEKAIPLLHKVLTENEAGGLDQVAAFYLGSAFQQLKRYDEAFTWWDKLYTELAKGLLPDVLNQLGKNYDGRSLSQKARETYELAHNIDPNNANALFFLGVWHDDKQVKNKAIQYFDRFLRAEGGNVIYKNLATQRLLQLRPPKPQATPSKPRN